MKRILSVLLCICMLLGLWACNPDGGETTAPRESTETAALTEETEPVSLATLPNPAEALSEESILEYPQLGDYQESVLLANVPGQGALVLLSARSDGTLDYIFCNSLDQDARGIQTMVEAGFQYYTISPEGEAVKQPSDWMDQLDQALTAGRAEVPYDDAGWYLVFSAWEGRILIRATLWGGQEHQCTMVYQVQDNQLTQLPFSLRHELDGKPVVISSDYIGSIYAFEHQYLMSSDSFFCFSYDGELVHSLGKKHDSLWSVFGYGGESVWFADAAQSRLTLMNINDFSVLEEYPIERGDVACHTATTDGESLYLLKRNFGESMYQLFRFDENGQETVISSPDVYAFGNPTAQPLRMAAVPGGDFYIWYGESGRGILRRYHYNPQGKQEHEIVTVYALEDNQTVRTAVSLWNRTHTDAVIQYTIATQEIAGTALTLEDAVTQLNTQLVNGEGPDILILDGLPVDSMIDKGFLHPLSDLDTTGVYPKLLERFTADGNLYAVPGKMTPYLLGRAVEGTQPVSSLEEFADAIIAATEQLDCSYAAIMGDSPLNKEGEPSHSWDQSQKALYYITYPDELFDLWYPAWCDAIWESGSFHPEVYQELLTQTGRLSEHYSLQTIDQMLTVYEESDKTGLTKTGYTIVNATDANNNDAGTYLYCLAATNYVGMHNFLPRSDPQFPGSAPSVDCEIIGIPGPDGTGATIPTAIAALREGGNAQAGVEFLQLLLSDEVQLGLVGDSYSRDGYPVKWSCTPALLEDMEQECDNTFHIQNDFRATLSALRPVILEDVTYNAAKEAALRYYEGKLTAQEAADQVAEATAIYLAEHRQ